jgi:hypothetical protein
MILRYWSNITLVDTQLHTHTRAKAAPRIHTTAVVLVGLLLFRAMQLLVKLLSAEDAAVGGRSSFHSCFESIEKKREDLVRHHPTHRDDFRTKLSTNLRAVVLFETVLMRQPRPWHSLIINQFTHPVLFVLARPIAETAESWTFDAAIFF